jgi:hypothetical protein
MGLTDAVQRDVERLRGRDPILADSGLAALALEMASLIDERRGSPSECGKVLKDALAELRELAPAERKKDRIDDLAERRRERLAGGSGA